MSWTLATICFVIPLAAVAAGMHPLLGVLREKSILDHPNERSSHDVPTPKGAGLLLVPAVAALWVLFIIFPYDAGYIPEVLGIAAIALALCGISWIDDLRGLPALLRLGVHLAAAGIALWLTPDTVLVFQGLLPPLLDHILTVLLWVWFINLFNFMDGIDGISGVQAIGICTGLIVVHVVSSSGSVETYLALILASGAAGLLLWNWPPARIFLGDAGSAPLGFMLAWLLIKLAGSGEWAAALILPLYYLADSTLTLLKRLFRGEKVWQAHRQHFYQRAVQNGHSHASVSKAVSIMNVCLVACAALTTTYQPLPGIVFAFVLVAGFLGYLAKSRN